MDQHEEQRVTMVEEVGENPYMAMRAAKIARNQAKLLELGLSPGTGGRQSKEATETAREKRRLAALVPPPSPKRRSLRIRRSGGPRDIENGDEEPNVEGSLPQDGDDQELLGSLTTGESPVVVPPKVEKIRARITRLDGEKLLESLLGVTLEATGKAHCMHECAKHALPEPVSSPISFNKYSGIQEWQNVIFLWINLHVPGQDHNKFLPEHRVTWYGGKQMTDESPIIQRLRGAAAAPDDIKILLWCREYNADTKAFYPYFCLGRLSLHSYDPLCRPIKFIWNLQDAESLLAHEDPSFRDSMQALIV